MNLKKICKTALYPPTALLLVLLPVSTVFLIYSMIFLGSTAAVSCISYALAAYTLTITCLRIPAAVALIRQFRESNRLVRAWLKDTRLRTKVGLHAALLFNTAYAVFHLALGFYHASFWFHSLAAYHLLLAIVRFFLLQRTKKTALLSPEQENRAFRTAGWFLLVINLFLALIIFFMVYWGRTFRHHEITTIAMSAYTFTALTLAVIGVVKHRKGTPVLRSARAISLASACVSMLTLESTMLTTFGGGEMSLADKRLFLGLSGGAISLFIIGMAMYMIVVAQKNLLFLKEHTHENP